MSYQPNLPSPLPERPWSTLARTVFLQGGIHSTEQDLCHVAVAVGGVAGVNQAQLN